MINVNSELKKYKITIMKPITLLLLAYFMVSNHGFSQGKLEKAEKSLSKKEESNRSYNNSRSRSRASNNYDDTYLFGDLLIEIGAIITYGIIFEAPGEAEYAASTASITKYPYLHSKKGNYSYDWGEDAALFRTTLSTRTVVENAKLYGNHLNADFRFFKRIGFEADYLQLWEDNTFFGDNSLAVYTFLAKYHRIRTERFDMYWGLGATYVDGEVDELGFTYGLGAELFFAKPLSLEANFNQAFINDTTVNKFNTLLNYHYKRYTFSGGYEHLKLGSVDFSTFSAGVGVSF